jgi:hypothetical protein
LKNAAGNRWASGFGAARPALIGDEVLLSNRNLTTGVIDETP